LNAAHVNVAIDLIRLIGRLGDGVLDHRATFEGSDMRRILHGVHAHQVATLGPRATLCSAATTLASTARLVGVILGSRGLDRRLNDAGVLAVLAAVLIVLTVLAALARVVLAALTPSASSAATTSVSALTIARR
jgi:hypothetical protein